MNAYWNRTKASQAQDRATLERACREYDLAHRTRLTSEIIKTIVRESRVTDANVVAIRTSELTDALADVLVTVLAMVPDMDVPSHLRQATENLCKRVRRDVAKARAEGDFDVFHGARREGHA